MKNTLLITILMTSFSLTAVAKTASNAKITEAKDIQWQAVAEFPGLSMAVLEGDATKGPHHSMLKFDSGFTAPLHHHTSDHFFTVVTGTMLITVEGVEHKLTPGSFASFKKKQTHSTICAAGAECMISLDVRGKWDVHVAKKLVTK